ncbi:MAG: hypothetical protein DRR42_15085 [Gammaproteobacteria bacterium]|nr:MAG: hypothetical protein DRR42_15085 [Gammaproteobacteria bacterium]
MFVGKGILKALVFFGLLLSGVKLFAQGTPPFEPQMLLPSDPDTVVIAYSEIPDMLANPDPTPMIRVFVDGEVLIHYPEYMKRAGDYQVFLNPGELRRLMIALSGVFDFNAATVRQAKRQAGQMQVPGLLVVSERSDKTLEQINIELDGYRGTAGAASRPVRQQIKWRDIEVDVGEYPEITGLAALGKARRTIRQLLERHDLLDLDSGKVIAPLQDSGEGR